MDYFEVPIVELPEARTSKIRDLTRPRSEDRFSYAGAAEDCLQEECSVDTVQMLVGQLKTREQELAKKGRIVDYEREAALAGVRTMIHDLEGPVRRAASFFTSRGATPSTRPQTQADPNPVVLAVKAAFDLNKASVYVNK